MFSHSKKHFRPIFIAVLVVLLFVAVALHFYTHMLSNISVELSENRFVYSESCERPEITLKYLTGNIVPKEKYSVRFNDDGTEIGTHLISIIGTYGLFGTTTTCYEICPHSTSIQSVLKDFNSLNVTWMTNSSDASGYHIAYSKVSSFKEAESLFINDPLTSEALIKNLNGDSTYFLRIRTFKDVTQDNTVKRTYSAWSQAQSVKVPSLFDSATSSLKGKKAIIIGDSLASGYHLGTEYKSNDVSKGWASQLASLLELDVVKIYPIVGTAFSQGFIDGGPSLLDLAKTMESDFSLETRNSTELIIIGAGINDSATWNGYLPSLEDIDTSARQTFEILHSAFLNAKICVFPVLETMGTHYEAAREEAVCDAIKTAANDSQCIDYCSGICNKMLVGWYGGLLENDWHSNEHGSLIIAHQFAVLLQENIASNKS